MLILRMQFYSFCSFSFLTPGWFVDFRRLSIHLMSPSSRGTPTYCAPALHVGSVHTPTVQKHRFENERDTNEFLFPAKKYGCKLTDNRGYDLFALRLGRIRVRGKGLAHLPVVVKA